MGTIKILCAHCAGHGEVISDPDGKTPAKDRLYKCPKCEGWGWIRRTLEQITNIFSELDGDEHGK